MPRSRKLPDKTTVHQALREAVAEAHRALVRAAIQSREAATHEESRAEGDKDMRSTEQSYVARGQAMRVEALADELQRLDAHVVHPLPTGAAVVVGALVQLRDENDDERLIYLCAQGAGTVLALGGVRVTVISPSSPLGQRVMARHCGEVFELDARGETREWTVVDVR